MVVQNANIRIKCRIKGRSISSFFTSQLMTRILSALVLVPVSLACMYFGGVYFLAFVFLAFIACLREWGRMVSHLDKGRLFAALFGLLYFFGCYALFVLMRFGENGFELIVLLLLTVWASDIGAYIFGKLIGGPKFVPSISPNKTWAGFFGGTISSIFIAHIFVYYMLPLSYDVLVISLIGAVVSVAAISGDLLMSFMKRKADVKDTGTLIPGHGGILDRIDSLILGTVPLAYFVSWGMI